MAYNVLLDSNQHRNLRILTERRADLGDDVMYVPTFPAEFRNLQAHFPIVFVKAEHPAFVPVALFGFREKQNLFLGPNGWDVPYLPLTLERLPFLIGKAHENHMVNVDLDSPRVSATEGERVFRDDGSPTEFLDRISEVLGTIHQGLPGTQPFVDALLEHHLLESFVLDIQFADGRQHEFGGFYTVQEERLGALDRDAVWNLHERGYLAAIYMVVASLSNFRMLIERANRQHSP